MVDEEVETTLREIRERVRRSAEVEADNSVAVVSNASNGLHPRPDDSPAKAAETMARIDAYLTTTARAWDRLPPLVSKRSGSLARLELWVKRRLKQATRWYSWEQINFNAAVHHALCEALDALRETESQMGQLRDEVSARMQAQEQQHQMEMETQRAEIESQRAAMEAHRPQLEAEQRTRSQEVNDRLADLARELREQDEQRLEEQRVSFKQLSLEMSEAEVLLDRTRRDIESRLDKLEIGIRES